MSFSAAAFPADLSASHDLLHKLLVLSPAAVLLLRPVQVAGVIADFTYEQLNPVAQRLLRLPAHPAESLLASVPAALAAELFAFCRNTFAAGQPGQYKASYPAEGGAELLLLAERSGELLVVSFAEPAALPSAAVEEVLRESRAREQAAEADAEAAHANLANVFTQAPAMICIFDGPAHTFQFVNPPYQALVGERPLLGRPIAEAMPELAGQPIFGLLDNVYQTGETFSASEMLVQLDHHNQGRTELEQRYYNFIYKARHNRHGVIDGILVFAYDVTAQVLAREQVQALNEELAAINEELRASNEEYLLANTALVETQQQLQLLNQELEARVQERTHKLAEQQALLRQILELMPAYAATLTGAEHRFGFVNTAYQQIAGQRAVSGLTVAEAIPEAVAQGQIATLDQVYTSGRAVSMAEVPMWLAQPSGLPRQHYLNLTYQPLPGPQGQPQDILAFGIDVTEQVLARQGRDALQAEQQRLFEQAPMAIVVLRGPRFIIEQANANAELIWGRTAAEVLGRPHFEALPDAAGQGFEEILTSVLQTGEAVVLREVLIELARSHTGQPNAGYYNIIFKPLRDEYKRVSGIAVMWTETTDQVLAREQVQALNEELAAINEELRATNEELQESNHRLTRTNVDLDTFVYTASHDLKAPITNIEGIVLALRETLPATVQQDTMVAHLLELLGQTVERFQFTIAQLTDLSKLQRAHSGPPELVGLAGVVESVRLDLAPMVVAADAQLTVTVPAGLVVSFSPANLRSIVYNLLSNAIKYRAPSRPAQVRVRATRTSQGVVLKVEDNGLGLSSQQQQRLFGLFQRLHTHVEGTGVGLYIVKRMVENGGGSISVQSQPNVGTTFTVVFPR